MACNSGLLSMSYGLPYSIVAYAYELLGSPGMCPWLMPVRKQKQAVALSRTLTISS